MKFDKSRVYTALNADELKVGSKVIFADSLGGLKVYAEEDNLSAVGILREVREEAYPSRFSDGNCTWHLAYLVEEPKVKKLEWSDLKVGDLITNGSFFCMVTGIDKREGTDKHIYVGHGWLTDKSLEEWEKVEKLRYQNED